MKRLDFWLAFGFGGLIPSAKRKHIANALVEGLDERYSPEKAAEAMISTGWIDDIDGHLYVHDWKLWQKQWYKAMKIRNYDNERKAKGRSEKEASAAHDKPSGDASEPKVQAGVTDTKTTNPALKAEPPKKSYSTGFEAFWEAYPRKGGKGAANKCYNARLKDGWSPEELLEAAREYAKTVKAAHTEERYIKLASTFLSASTPFTDYIAKKRKEDGRPEWNEKDPFADWR